jgi:spore maturation protein CgeB
MNDLDRNLDALRGRQPELAERLARSAARADVEARRARTGAFTLAVEGRLEASAEDPEAEGAHLAAHFRARAEEVGAERLVVFGLGVHTLRGLADFPGHVLVVEPSLELCRAVLEHVDLSAALRKVELVVGGEPTPALAHPLFSAEARGLFLAHATARRRAPALHDALAQRFHPGGTRSPLDIAVIPPLYGGSLPVARSCARALRQLGHRVREIDLEPFLPAYQAIDRLTGDLRLGSASEELRGGLTRVIGEALRRNFQLDPPDLVFALAQAPLDPLALEGFAALGIARAFWFCEDFRVMPYWRGLARSYDVFFHVQPDDFAGPLRAAGGYGVPLPMAFDPSTHHPVSLTAEEQERYGSRVSFLGAGYHNRREFLPGLLDLGLRLWGTEWPACAPFVGASPEFNRRQSPQTSNLIFNASEINLNLHSSPWTDGVNPVGDYLNPRAFELAGARAFQLCDVRRDLPRALEPGSEVETFRDLAECRKKIEYYLARPDERDDIAERAHRRALAEHTYTQRMERAIDALRAGPVPLVARRRGASTAGDVAARAEAELALVLRRLEPDRVLDGEALAEAVARGEGELTRDEKLLLLVRESLGEIRILNAAGDPA